MLALHLTQRSARGAWLKKGRGFAVSDGVINPIDHPALENFAAATADELLVAVRERCATAAPSGFDALARGASLAAVSSTFLPIVLKRSRQSRVLRP
jgi:hypothetical protein